MVGERRAIARMALLRTKTAGLAIRLEPWTSPYALIRLRSYIPPDQVRGKTMGLSTDSVAEPMLKPVFSLLVAIDLVALVTFGLLGLGAAGPSRAGDADGLAEVMTLLRSEAR